MDAREINKAMAAHGAWKVRLREAIETGTSDHDPHHLSDERQCEFGKWLHSIPVEDRTTEFWGKARTIHARFHLEAAKILELALTGKQREALDLVTDLKGDFVTTSIELTNTLHHWKSVSS